MPQRLPSARVLATRVLREVERKDAFSNRVLARHLERYPGLDPRDRGLVTTLVYGVLRHRRRLDAHIDRHAKRPAGLKGEIRQALRVGAFELRELERPAPIAVSEARKVVAKLDGGARLGGVVQAVLSAIDRTGAEVDAELAGGSTLDALEGRWSIPRWLAGRWIKHLGDDVALARARALADPPPVDVRIDASRIDPADALARLRAELPGAELEPVPPNAVRIRGGGDVFYAPMHDEGLVSVQGLAAQQPARVLAPSPGQRILDACAGMGVKTLQLAELMERRGTIVAADVDARALGELDALRARGRLGDALTLEVVTADLSLACPELDDAPFDGVLVDVPCTGLGNLARHPEIRERRQFEDVAARARLQRDLLNRSLDRARAGAPVVYAVCSIEPEEGPQVVVEVASARGAEIVEEKTFTPEGDRTEGFYLARLHRP